MTPMSLPWDPKRVSRNPLGLSWGSKRVSRDSLGLPWGPKSDSTDPLGLSWEPQMGSRDPLGLPWDPKRASRDPLGLPWDLKRISRAPLGLPWGPKRVSKYTTYAQNQRKRGRWMGRSPGNILYIYIYILAWTRTYPCAVRCGAVVSVELSAKWTRSASFGQVAFSSTFNQKVDMISQDGLSVSRSPHYSRWSGLQ